MNRAQFMEQLKKLLSDISEEERQEALEYYESYFDDAGEEQEAEVVCESTLVDADNVADYIGKGL